MIEIRPDDKGGIDEVVAHNCTAHLERIGSDQWFLSITLNDGTGHAFWLSREKRSVNIVLDEPRP